MLHGNGRNPHEPAVRDASPIFLLRHNPNKPAGKGESKFMKRLNVLLLALLLGCSLFALPASAAEGVGVADAPKTEAVSEVPTVKQLRGKLL